MAAYAQFGYGYPSASQVCTKLNSIIVSLLCVLHQFLSDAIAWISAVRCSSLCARQAHHQMTNETGMPHFRGVLRKRLNFFHVVPSLFTIDSWETGTFNKQSWVKVNHIEFNFDWLVLGDSTSTKLRSKRRWKCFNKNSINIFGHA